MKASVHYLKEMARGSERGNYEVMIAEYYLQKLEWGMAVQLLERGIAKGGLSSVDKAYRLLAECYRCLGLEKLAESASSKVKAQH